MAEAREIVHRAIEFARTHGQPARVLALQTLVQLGDAELDAVSRDFETIGDVLAAAAQAGTSHRLAGRRGSALTANDVFCSRCGTRVHTER